MTRERLEELKRLHEAAFANEGGHGISDAPIHEFRQAVLAALPRFLLERERLREQVLAAIGQCCGRLCLGSAPESLCIACQERRKALAFVEEEA